MVLIFIENCIHLRIGFRRNHYKTFLWRKKKKLFIWRL